MDAGAWPREVRGGGVGGWVRVVVNQNLDAAGDASTHGNECCWLQLEIKQETLVHFVRAFVFVFEVNVRERAHSGNK